MKELLLLFKMLALTAGHLFKINLFVGTPGPLANFCGNYTVNTNGGPGAVDGLFDLESFWVSEDR